MISADISVWENSKATLEPAYRRRLEHLTRSLQINALPPEHQVANEPWLMDAMSGFARTPAETISSGISDLFEFHSQRNLALRGTRLSGIKSLISNALEAYEALLLHRLNPLIEETPDAETGPNETVDYLNLVSQELNLAFKELPSIYDNEELPDSFYRKINDLFLKYGSLVLAATSQLVRSHQIHSLELAELLIALGECAHSTSRASRLFFIKNFLRNSAATVRDAAGLALASIDDPSALSVIEDAIKSEQNPVVRSNLEIVLNQLRETQNANVLPDGEEQP